MNKAKRGKEAFTPGPFTILDFDGKRLEIGRYDGDNCREVASVPYQGGCDREDEANARLVAASWEMYRDLGWVLDRLRDGKPVTIEPDSVVARRIERTIEKALNGAIDDGREPEKEGGDEQARVG